MKKLMIPIGVLVLGIAGGFIGSMFSGSKEPEVAAAVDLPPPPPPQTHYLALDPEFIVNFQQPSSTEFLMIDVTVASTDAEVATTLEKHMPELRNTLLMLFSKNATKTLFEEQGKSALREMALQHAGEVLSKHYENGKIDDLFFTRFVMQ